LKKAIALFSTLLILVLVIMLMSISLKNSLNIKIAQKSDKDLVQENISVNDVKKFIDKKLIEPINRKAGKEKNQMYNKLFKIPISINNPIDNATISIEIKSNDGKININNFFNNFDTSEFRENFLVALGILDIKLFTRIFLANITDDAKLSSSYKLVTYSTDFKPGSIKSLDEFNQVLDIYIQKSNDYKAKDIIWDEYIKYEGAGLDINYMDILMIDALPITLDSAIREGLIKKTLVISSFDDFGFSVDNQAEFENILNKNKVGFKNIEIFCDINIKSINYLIQYTFNYGLKNKKINNLSLDKWDY